MVFVIVAWLRCSRSAVSLVTHVVCHCIGIVLIKCQTALRQNCSTVFHAKRRDQTLRNRCVSFDKALVWNILIVVSRVKQFFCLHTIENLFVSKIHTIITKSYLVNGNQGSYTLHTVLY